MKPKPSPDTLPALDSRRNILAFGGDSTFFNIGVFFMPATTVMTALAARLTTDKTLIGLISLAWYVSNLLPQLVAASALRGKARTKPYAVWPSFLFRPAMLGLALWLVITRAAAPQLTVWVILLSMVVFNASDGVVGVAWFDMAGRSLSARGRARTLTGSGLIAGICGIPVGLVVERILAWDQLSFPLNYALIIGIAFVFFMLSAMCMVFVQERPGQTAAPDAGAHTAPARVDFAAQLRATVRGNPWFRNMLLARLLTGVETMAAAFYVVFARERLNLPESSVGVLTLAYVTGSLTGVAVFGWLAERYGSRRVIHVACTVQFVAPTIALLASASTGLPAAVPYVLLVMAMGLNGMLNRSGLVGFSSYAQDRAPEPERPMYVGAVNTVAGTASMLPVVGGLALDGLIRAGAGPYAYSAVFGAAVICTCAGMIISYRLPEAHRR